MYRVYIFYQQYNLFMTIIYYHAAVVTASTESGASTTISRLSILSLSL